MELLATKRDLRKLASIKNIEKIEARVNGEWHLFELKDEHYIPYDYLGLVIKITYKGE